MSNAAKGEAADGPIGASVVGARPPDRMILLRLLSARSRREARGDLVAITEGHSVDGIRTALSAVRPISAALSARLAFA
jgi:hypothetical protein